MKNANNGHFFLVSPVLLKSVLLNISERNKFIESLLDRPFSDIMKQSYERILAFWLGETVTFNDIRRCQHLVKHLPTICVIYYCVLLLDKAFFAFHSSAAISGKIQEAISNIFLYYNSNCHLIVKNEKLLIKNLIKIVEKSLGRSGINHKVANDLGRICIDELKKSQQMCDAGALIKPGKFVVSEFNKKISYGKEINKHCLNIIISLFEKKRHLFLSDRINLKDVDNSIRKVLIKSEVDNVIDGFLVKHKGGRRTVVLALTGHFQAESNYIANGFFLLKKVFGADTFFLNHRNFSTRSVKWATTENDIVMDILSAVKYLRLSYDHVVLYGMCGGAAHMIMAAHRLHQENLSFKLIVDRFPAKFYHFIDPKTMVRMGVHDIHWRYTRKDLSANQLIMLIVLMPVMVAFYLSLTLLARSFLYLSEMDIDFSRLLKEIPDENVMVLQAKSRKYYYANKSHRVVGDLVVHPLNDARYHLKDRRSNKKNILKNLFDKTADLKRAIMFDEEVAYVVNLFSECFSNCLLLIDNEKLTSKIVEEAAENQVFSSTIDVHGCRLDNLQTRNSPILSEFVGGFVHSFYKGQKIFGKLHEYDTEMITSLFLKRCRSDLSHEQANHLSVAFSQWIDGLKCHENMLSIFDVRLKATGLTHFSRIINRLYELILTDVTDHPCCHF